MILRNSKGKFIALVLVGFVLLLTLSGCSNDTPQETTGTGISGLISLSGSTSMEKVAKALAEDFMNTNQNATVDVQLGGSSVGISDVLSGKSDIGNASRELKESETGIEGIVIAIDGIAVIVHNSNPILNLSKQDLIDIFTGKIKNWSELGGDNLPIVVVGREASSGTRGAFEEILGIADQCVYAQEKNETGMVKTAISTTPQAIGYVSLEVIDAEVKTVDIDNINVSLETIRDGSYSLSRPFIMAIKEGEQKPEVQAFIDYVLTDGQYIVESLGLVSVR